MQIERHWVLIKILQNQKRPKSTDELWSIVNNDIQNVSKRVSKRTVERDMALLAAVHSEVVQHTEGRTNKWSWKPSEKIPIQPVKDDTTRLADETRVLREVLQPLSFESRITQHILGFVGREWVFDAYSQWLDHLPESRLFWIKASPGFGKSAIAANLVHRKRSSIAASWFCDAKSIELKDPSKVLKSIAFQIALCCEDYRIRLLNKIQLYANASTEYCDELRRELGKKNIQDLFLLILAEPLASIWREHKIVVVIDALDEVTDERGNNKIAELIGKELSSLPEWIVFVVTSRPEANVNNHLSGFRPIEIDADDPRNQVDLRNWYKEYLGKREEIQELSSAEQQQIEDLLIERSSGMILFLKVVEEGFQEGSLTVEGIEALASGLPGLNRRYSDSFQHRFGSDYDNAIKPLVRLLLAAGGSLPEDLACEVLRWNSEQFLACRNRLGSYVDETTTGYEFFHQTLSEWLSDKSSGPFHLDRALGRQMLANVLFEELKNKDYHLLRWRMAIQSWLPAWLPQLSQYDDPWLVRSLGSALSDWADYSTARPLLERSLAIIEKSFGYEHPETASSLGSLALLLNEQGDYAGAEPLFHQALAIYEKALGPDHPDTATSINNLALLLGSKCDYAGAETLYRRALSINEKSLGSDHPRTALSLQNLAWSLKMQGNYSEAEPLLRRALAIREETLGPEHPDTAMTLDNFAHVLQAQGDYSGAEPLLGRALTIRERTLGPEHPYTATSLGNIANLLEIQGNYTAAEPLYRRALAIYEKVLGPEHPYTATSLGNLAELLRYQGEYAGAEPLQRRALSIIEKTLGHDHLSAATSINNLALLLQAQGDYAGAETLYRRAVEIYGKTLGPEHPDTVTSSNNLALLLQVQSG